MSVITTIQELKLYSAQANLGTKMDSFKPSCNYIYDTVIAPELGNALANSLKAAYLEYIENNTAMSDALSKLLPEVRKALAPLALLHYKAQVIAQLSDAGVTEKAADQGVQARMWVLNLQNEIMEEEGQKQIENLLAFLEANKTDYSEWTSSTAYTEYKELLLYTVKLFNSEVDINSSRLLFRRLRPSIKKAEKLALAKAIGSDMYQRLFANDLTADEKKLLKMCYPVIANFAMAEAPFQFRLDNDGAYTSSASATSYAKYTAPANAQEVAALKEQFYRTGRQYLDELVKYLNDTASPTLYAEFYESDLYVNPGGIAPPKINDTSEKIFVT